MSVNDKREELWNYCHDIENENCNVCVLCGSHKKYSWKYVDPLKGCPLFLPMTMTKISN